MNRQYSVWRQFFGALLVSSLVSVGLLGWFAWQKQMLVYDFMLWNLFLAWIPLLLALRLNQVLRTKLWSSWEAMAVSVAWLLFLPNSFYMVSDFIHLRNTGESDVLYLAVMFSAFISTALVLGMASLQILHKNLLQHFTHRITIGFIAITLLLSSGAIYIGRDLRWNSWDVFLNPGGVLFDVSDRLLRPFDYPSMFVTMFSFFVFLASTYYVAWRISELVKRLPRS